jgi:hypothetical protein
LALLEVEMRARYQRQSRAGIGVVIAVLIATVTVSPAAAADPRGKAVGISDINSVAMAHGALGVYLDSSGAPVVVVPSERMASLTAADMAPPGVSVRIQETDVTAATVQSLEDDLTAIRSKATSDYAFYFDLKTSKEVVQTKSSGSEFAEIAAKYPGHVEIQAGATGGLAAAVYSDRMHDIARFWGGALVNPPGGNLCTLGFEAHNGSYYYTSTAGHCYARGTKVYSGSGDYVGYVSGREYPTWDIEWIYGSRYSPVIYNGTVTQSGFPSGPRIADDLSHISVYGRKFAWVGQTGYCATGWRTGRVCDWNVTSVHATFIRLDGNVTGDLYAYSGTAEIEGNSGGPVYYPYNGGALVVGTVVGYFDKGLGNTNYSTKAAESLAHWNLEVVCASTCVIQP